MVTPTQSQGNKDFPELVKKIDSRYLPLKKLEESLKKKNNSYSYLDRIFGGVGSYGGSPINNYKTQFPIYQTLNGRRSGILGLSDIGVDFIYHVDQSSNKKKVTITIERGKIGKDKNRNRISTFFNTNIFEREIDPSIMARILSLAQSYIAVKGKLTDDLGKSGGMYAAGEINGNKIKVSYYGNVSGKKLFMKGDIKALSTIFAGDKFVIEVEGDEAGYRAAEFISILDPTAAEMYARYYPGTEFENIYQAHLKRGYRGYM
ncbi:MAG: hypothetical protein OH318_02295 [Candidatus Parvarchaeota archaeon]|nr:hypothetical protein [Candidatus Rehaiarchaeum fermentans]